MGTWAGIDTVLGEKFAERKDCRFILRMEEVAGREILQRHLCMWASVSCSAMTRKVRHPPNVFKSTAAGWILEAEGYAETCSECRYRTSALDCKTEKDFLNQPRSHR